MYTVMMMILFWELQNELLRDLVSLEDHNYLAAKQNHNLILLQCYKIQKKLIWLSVTKLSKRIKLIFDICKSILLRGKLISSNLVYLSKLVFRKWFSRYTDQATNCVLTRTQSRCVPSCSWVLLLSSGWRANLRQPCSSFELGIWKIHPKVYRSNRQFLTLVF